MGTNAKGSDKTEAVWDWLADYRVQAWIVGIITAGAAVIAIAYLARGGRTTPAGSASPPSPPMTAEQLEIAKENSRIAFARVLEERLLEKWYSADVFTTGPRNTVVNLKWPLASKALAYHFTKSGKTLQEAKALGFEKFVITDGYSNKWEWKLTERRGSFVARQATAEDIQARLRSKGFDVSVEAAGEGSDEPCLVITGRSVGRRLAQDFMAREETVTSLRAAGFTSVYFERSDSLWADTCELGTQPGEESCRIIH